MIESEEKKQSPSIHINKSHEQRLQPITKSSSTARMPSSVTSLKSNEFQRPKPNPLIERNPQSVSEIKIGNSFAVLENVFALPKEKFHGLYGTKVSEFKNLIFFKPSDLKAVPIGSTPVAMNTTTLKLYPVSQIIHLRNVDANLRSQLLSEGAKEYYYQSRLKMMSIETGPNTVLQTYRDFLNRGLNAKLEVLKDPPSVK